MVETLVARLGLADEELLQVFQSDPLSVVSGELDARPEVGILLALTEDIDPALLRRWLRTQGPGGRPIDLLMRQNFSGFEDAVLILRERGIVLRGGSAPDAGPVA